LTNAGRLYAGWRTINLTDDELAAQSGRPSGAPSKATDFPANAALIDEAGG
jgi:hypothetical protein